MSLTKLNAVQRGYLIVWLKKTFPNHEKLLHIIDLKKTTDKKKFELLESHIPRHKQTYMTNMKRITHMTHTIVNLLRANTCVPKNILDIGCADGGIVEQVALHYGTRANGCDTRNICTANINFSLITNKLPYMSCSMDLILCIHVLHHMKKLRSWIKEILRVLKPDGCLLIREHDGDNGILSAVHEFYRIAGNESAMYEKYYTASQFDKMLTIPRIYITPNIDNIPLRQYWALYKK
jgi:SAM-dependent methyltransferase